MSHTAQHEENHGTGEIKKVTIILSVLTIVELLLGFWMMDITEQLIEKIAMALHGSTELQVGDKTISFTLYNLVEYFIKTLII